MLDFYLQTSPFAFLSTLALPV